MLSAAVSIPFRNWLQKNFECADAWDHAVAVSFAVVWDKLAITVVVGPLLGHRVEDELDLWVEG